MKTDVCTFVIISHSIFLRRRNVLHKVDFMSSTFSLKIILFMR